MDRLPDELVRHVAAYAGLQDGLTMAHVCSTWRYNFDTEEMTKALKDFAKGDRKVIAVMDHTIAHMQSIFETAKEGLVRNHMCCTEDTGELCKWSALNRTFLDTYETLKANLISPVIVEEVVSQSYCSPMSFEETTLSKCTNVAYSVNLALINAHALNCEKQSRNSLVVLYGYEYIFNNLKQRIAEVEESMAILLAYRRHVAGLLTPALPEGAFGRK